MTAQHETEVELNGQTVAEEIERRMNAEYRGVWATDQELEEDWARLIEKYPWLQYSIPAIFVLCLVVLLYLEFKPIAPFP